MIRTIKSIAVIGGLGAFGYAVYKAVDSYLEDQKAKRMKAAVDRVLTQPSTLDQEQKDNAKEAYATALQDFKKFDPKNIAFLTGLAKRYNLAQLRQWQAEKNPISLNVSCLGNDGVRAFLNLIPYLEHAERVIKVNNAAGPIPWKADKAFVARLNASTITSDLFRRMLKFAIKEKEYLPLVKALKEAGCKLITAKDPAHQKGIAGLQLDEKVKETEVYHAFYKYPDLYLVPQGNGFQADLIEQAEIHTDGLWAKFPNTSHIGVNNVPKATIWSGIARYIKDEQLCVSVDVLRNWWGSHQGKTILIHIERPQQTLSDIKVFRAIETFIWEISGEDFQKYSEGMIKSGLGQTKAAEKFRKDLVKHYKDEKPPEALAEPSKRLKAADKVGANAVAVYLKKKGTVFYFPEKIENTLTTSVWELMQE